MTILLFARYKVYNLVSNGNEDRDSLSQYNVEFQKKIKNGSTRISNLFDYKE